MPQNNYFHHPSSGSKVTYATVLKALVRENRGKPFWMSLASQDEIRAVIDVVNHGIDAHLEACNIPANGDKFETVEHKIEGRVYSRTLDCTLSPDSLCCILRRLSEIDFDSSNEAGSLVACILQTLGIDEYGKLVGCEVLGLA